jgi:pimeloyl-ACP methyl ester carboxylesterase
MLARNPIKAVHEPESTANENAGTPDADLIQIGDSEIALRVLIHRQTIANKRALVIVNSVDYPIAPSLSFREKMWHAGYQVIFVERPGFGSSKPLPSVLLEDTQIKSGATVAAEAAVLLMLLKQLELKQIVLLGMGSANPVCYRLARLSNDIELSIFSNAMFNQNIWGVFRPNWFQGMLRQTVVSTAGLKFASYGVKHQLKKAPLKFYRDVLQKSPGDLRYLEDNKQDFVLAAQMIRNIDTATLNYDLKMSLGHDERLRDQFFDGLNAVVLSGLETTDLWQSQLASEADRLSLPLVYAPSGDLYAPYASPDTLLSTIDEHSSIRGQSAWQSA